MNRQQHRQQRRSEEQQGGENDPPLAAHQDREATGNEAQDGATLRFACTVDALVCSQHAPVQILGERRRVVPVTHQRQVVAQSAEAVRQAGGVDGIACRSAVDDPPPRCQPAIPGLPFRLPVSDVSAFLHEAFLMTPSMMMDSPPLGKKANPPAASLKRTPGPCSNLVVDIQAPQRPVPVIPVSMPELYLHIAFACSLEDNLQKIKPMSQWRARETGRCQLSATLGSRLGRTRK